MVFASVFAIVVGALMIGQWAFSIMKGQVPGPEAGTTAGRGILEMWFHWFAEFGTAFALIASGAGLLSGSTWGEEVFLVSTGMLVYTVMNSPGYFAQQRQWPMVGIFIIILALAITSVIFVV